MKKFDNSKSVLKNKIKEPTTKPTNKPISNLHFDYLNTQQKTNIDNNKDNDNHYKDLYENEYEDLYDIDNTDFYKNEYNDFRENNDNYNRLKITEVNEIDKINEYVLRYTNRVDLSFFSKLYIVKLQRWWKKKYEIILKIKFLQDHFREYLNKKKFRNEVLKKIFVLFNMNTIIQKIDKRRFFKNLKAYDLMLKCSISHTIKIQKKIRSFLKRKNLLKQISAVKLEELIINYSEKCLNELNSNSEKCNINTNLDKIKDNHQNDQKNIINNLESEKNFTIGIEKNQLMVNSLENNDDSSISSSKKKKIYLKTSSRDYLAEKISFNEKLKMNNDLVNSKIETNVDNNIKDKIDDDLNKKGCLYRKCPCLIF